MGQQGGQNSSLTLEFMAWVLALPIFYSVIWVSYSIPLSIIFKSFCTKELGKPMDRSA